LYGWRFSSFEIAGCQFLQLDPMSALSAQSESSSFVTKLHTETTQKERIPHFDCSLFLHIAGVQPAEFCDGTSRTLNIIETSTG